MFSNQDLRRLIIPLTAEQMLTSLMGIADTMMVTSIGDAALSGVSLVDAINNIIIYLFTALATGGTVVCSQYLGRGDERGAGHAAKQVLLAAFVLAVACTAVCVPARDLLLNLIFGRAEASVIENASTYLLITGLSFPFIALYSASAALFRATGNSRLPMLVSFVANLVNVAGNAVLIFVFDLGVAGAAISTLASRILSALAMLYFQHRPGTAITVERYRAIRPDLATIRLILRIGIPTGLENGMFHFGRLAIQSAVSTLGTASIAAHAMIQMIENVATMPGLAIGTALLTVSGQCMGAGRPEEARYYTKKLTLTGEVVIVVFLAIIVALTRPITQLAHMEPESAAITWDMVLIVSLVKIVPWTCSFILPNGMRAAGDVQYSMWVSTISMWVFRVGLCYLLCYTTDLGLMSIWLGMFADWFCRAGFFLARFLSGKWMAMHVLDD